MLMDSAEITRMLVAWRNGDSQAFEKLAPVVYRELHRLAKRYLAKERPGHTLQTTALVHEAYLRLIDANHVPWQSRTHFFAVSAQMMRRILVDFARSHQALKHGGAARPMTLDDAAVISREPDPNLVAMDDALNILATLDARQCQVVELRFFGGLSLEETAEVLKVSVGTVRRDWTLARAWLHRELSGGSPATGARSEEP
jgi:RNA polymerase sigma factor (TIGR02999 family)